MTVYFHSQLLFQVVSHPQVVVTGKKINWDTLIPECRQSGQNPDKAFGNHLIVFEPELKQVANEKDGSSISCNTIQALHQPVFPLPAQATDSIRAQVGIREKVKVFSFLEG